MPILNIRVSPTGQPRYWRVEIEGQVLSHSTREPLRELAMHMLAAGFAPTTIIAQVATPDGKCRRATATLGDVLRAPDRSPFAAPQFTTAPSNGVH